jgi:hypothetical protein
MCDNAYELPYSINIRISLSFRRAFRSIESMSMPDLLRNRYFLVECFDTLLQDKYFHNRDYHVMFSSDCSGTFYKL